MLELTKPPGSLCTLGTSVVLSCFAVESPGLLPGDAATEEGPGSTGGERMEDGDSLLQCDESRHE